MVTRCVETETLQEEGWPSSTVLKGGIQVAAFSKDVTLGENQIY